MLESGADPNIKDAKGFTALHYAVRERKESTVRILLAGGARVDEATNKGLTPLHVACSLDCDSNGGGQPLSSLLISQGASPMARDIRGRTPLHHAAVSGNASATSVLLKAIKQTITTTTATATTTTPIDATTATATAADASTVSVGIAAAVTDSRGRTALHAAAEAHQTRVAQLLIRAGFDRCAQDRQGRTPHCLALGSDCQDRELLRLLDGERLQGDNVELQDENGSGGWADDDYDDDDANDSLMIADDEEEDESNDDDEEEDEDDDDDEEASTTHSDSGYDSDMDHNVKDAVAAISSLF